MTVDPDDLDPLDQPGALEHAAELLGVPVEVLAAQRDADLALAAEVAVLNRAELAALPPAGPTAAELAEWADQDAALVRELAAAVGFDAAELAELLDLDPPDDDPHKEE